MFAHSTQPIRTVSLSAGYIFNKQVGTCNFLYESFIQKHWFIEKQNVTSHCTDKCRQTTTNTFIRLVCNPCQPLFALVCTCFHRLNMFSWFKHHFIPEPNTILWVAKRHKMVNCFLTQLTEQKIPYLGVKQFTQY